MSADRFKLKRGTTAAVNAYLPAQGEPVYDTTLKILKIGDGVTLGGVEPASTNANLAALSGLTGAADRGFYFTGVGAMSLFTLTPVARALLDDTTVAAQRTTLGATSVGDSVFTAVDATAARLAIGAVIGTDVQGFDSDLAALAANVTNGSWHRTGAGTGAARVLTGTANELIVTNGDGVSGNPTISVPTSLNYAGKTFTNAGIMTTVDINGGTVDGTVIGGASPAAGTFTTTSATTATISTSLNLTGGQIAFPATQVPSANVNTLDDYEEGTWTPTITFTTPGNINVVYSARVGQYTKIGRMVQVTCSLLTSTFTHTTASGGFIVTGLPFTVGSDTGVSLGLVDGVTMGSNNQMFAYANTGSTTVSFLSLGLAGASNVAVSTTQAATGVQKQIIFSFTYNV